LFKANGVLSVFATKVRPIGTLGSCCFSLEASCHLLGTDAPLPVLGAVLYKNLIVDHPLGSSQSKNNDFQFSLESPMMSLEAAKPSYFGLAKAKQFKPVNIFRLDGSGNGLCSRTIQEGRTDEAKQYSVCWKQVPLLIA